ncbi:unnamed protein product [Ilex paraguariensis]|uniref:Uncharacterized protein n=1 Tax=Ilex paraguariensis TaxID=185542 RepID=A0ABC8S621_9AQUA
MKDKAEKTCGERKTKAGLWRCFPGWEKGTSFGGFCLDPKCKEWRKKISIHDCWPICDRQCTRVDGHKALKGDCSLQRRHHEMIEEAPVMTYSTSYVVHCDFSDKNMLIREL